MLRTLAERGFSGLGVDLSEVAVRMASETLAGLEDRVQIVLAGAEDGTGPYDCVVCFEVLEHIRDDQAALRRWRALLRSGGRLLLSVPAGPRRWGPSDEVVGHYRRYSRAGLHELLDRTGFRVEHLWCYGFPVANLSQYFGNRADRQRSAQTAAIPREERMLAAALMLRPSSPTAGCGATQHSASSAGCKRFFFTRIGATATSFGLKPSSAP